MAKTKKRGIQNTTPEHLDRVRRWVDERPRTTRISNQRPQLDWRKEVWH